MTNKALNERISDLFEKKQEMEDHLNQLVRQYKYRKLPYEVSVHQRNFYMDELPSFWKDKEYQKFEIELVTKNGMTLAKGVTARGFVCGDYGVFLEMEDNQVIKENIKVKEGEEYRINDPHYAETVKYEWYTDKSDTGVKLYHQKRRVTYADYRPEKWYVSPYEVIAVKLRKRTISPTPDTDDSVVLQQELFE